MAKFHFNSHWKRIFFSNWIEPRWLCVLCFFIEILNRWQIQLVYQLKKKDCKWHFCSLHIYLKNNIFYIFPISFALMDHSYTHKHFEQIIIRENQLVIVHVGCHLIVELQNSDSDFVFFHFFSSVLLNTTNTNSCHWSEVLMGFCLYLSVDWMHDELASILHKRHSICLIAVNHLKNICK